MSRISEIAELYEKHAAELLVYFARRCPAADANDLVQETFLQVVRNPELASVTLPRAWLFGIARHMLSRHYREQSARMLTEPEALAEKTAGTTSDPRLGAVREAIEQLSPELRETLHLRLEQELTYEEIAVVLEIPIGTVRSRLHNAVQRLQQALHPTPSSSSSASS